MSTILTNDECDALIAQIVDPIATYGRLIAYARAVEAAVLAKLAQQDERQNLPEQKRLGSDHTRSGIYGYTAEQMKDYADAREAAVLAKLRRLHAENEAKDVLLRQARAVIRWQCFGECRTEGVEGLPTPSEVDSAIRQHLNKSKQ